MPPRALRRTLAAAVLLAIGAPARPQPPTPAPRRFVIDSHQHYEDKPDYFERLVKGYRARNAMACVLTPYKWIDHLRKAAAAYPDVVIPYGQISVDDAEMLAQIDAFVAMGAKGIKMHTPRKDWDDESYFPIYAKLQEKNLVALFHTGIVCTIVDGAC